MLWIIFLVDKAQSFEQWQPSATSNESHDWLCIFVVLVSAVAVEKLIAGEFNVKKRKSRDRVMCAYTLLFIIRLLRWVHMYDHKNIDAKWQEIWEEKQVFRALDPSETDKDPYYCLVEFPFPSGAGLHVGHPRSYTALDVIARKRRMEGYNVLYPIGWDAFGLPTENYAIKTGRNPQEVTQENIATFKRQLQALGLSFDWSREVSTTDPEYYKWTQWMFLEFFKAGLAYKDKVAINWCKSCKIGLANEEVVQGACERCGGEIEKREIEQWMIRITDYADRLIEDLDKVDYLEKIKKSQIEWIGRSTGTEIDFRVSDSDQMIKVFTTRPDTIFGATYMVLAPEHSLVTELTIDDQHSEVESYVKEAAKKSDIDRGNDEKEKTGVFTGSYAVNPMNDEKIPIWVADYVLMGYGTGAIMAVPAHDERDFAFATKYTIPIIDVVDGEGELPRPGSGSSVNSGEFDGLTTEEAKEKITAKLKEIGAGKATTNYRLRDWVFSRQRYWGEPIPLVHCESCSSETDGWVAIPESELPLILPEIEKYEPTDDGKSPLASDEAWVHTTCPSCHGPAKRETDTMPNWAGSSWYFLRYIDAKNNDAFASEEALKYWTPVNWYNGGMEHATLHLLYARFWHKFLFDRGHVPTDEPFAKRTSHGLIMAEDGTKMSKSKGNVVNPDEIVQSFGADTLRIYELFMGPFSEAVPWSTNGVIGMKRFLDKVVRAAEHISDSETEEVIRELHKTIQKVTEDIEGMRFNTAIAQMMSFVNLIGRTQQITQESFDLFLTLLNPFAPHVTNELHSSEEPIDLAEWPVFDPNLAKDDQIELAVQVNGKLRGTIMVAADITESEAKAQALESENVQKFVVSEPKKVIFVPGRLINFVL